MFCLLPLESCFSTQIFVLTKKRTAIKVLFGKALSILSLVSYFHRAAIVSRHRHPPYLQLVRVCRHGVEDASISIQLPSSCFK